MALFEKKTGNYSGNRPLERMDDNLLAKLRDATQDRDGYTVTNSTLGKRYDGGRSLLNVESDSQEDPFITRIDVDAIADGKVGHKFGEWVGNRLRRMGVDPEKLLQMHVRKRLKILKKLERVAKSEQRRARGVVDEIEVVNDGSEITGPYDSLVSVFRDGADGDPVLWKDEDGNEIPTCVRVLRNVWNKVSNGITPEQFAGRSVSDAPIIKLCRRVSGALRVADNNAKGRIALYNWLATWDRGPLRLERPQTSSLHHLIDYDNVAASSSWDFSNLDNCQIVLVENDWGASVPPVEGEWRLPFEFMCWEFRLDGVRVLAFTGGKSNEMYLVLGHDGHWTIDAYQYELGLSTLPVGNLFKGATKETYKYEMRNAARRCYDAIRATCIMLDAQISRHEKVVAPAKIAERRVVEGKSPLRDHYVVRLLHEQTRAYSQRARSAGAGTGGPRAAQRGHWRKGTWVHYDDQDSGQVQYTNDGGFIVSKTWRRWHFAGDPRNIIHKEYKV